MCNLEPGRLQEAAGQLNRFAFRHVVPILLAPPAAPPDGMRNASGFFVRLPEGVYLGTAWHVVEHWIHRRAQGVPVLFQLSDNLAIDPEASMAWRDEANDIVFIRVTEEQVARVDASVCEPLPIWPPAHPIANGDLFVSGFPGQLRQRDGARDVNFRSFSAHLIIREVRPRFVACVFDHDYLTDVDGNRIPVAELDLGGMSGGPAFLVGRLAYPVVALVSEFAMGIVRLATLSHVVDLANDDDGRAV